MNYFVFTNFHFCSSVVFCCLWLFVLFVVTGDAEMLQNAKLKANDHRFSIKKYIIVSHLLLTYVYTTVTMLKEPVGIENL